MIWPNFYYSKMQKVLIVYIYQDFLFHNTTLNAVSLYFFQIIEGPKTLYPSLPSNDPQLLNRQAVRNTYEETYLPFL